MQPYSVPTSQIHDLVKATLHIDRLRRMQATMKDRVARVQSWIVPPPSWQEQETTTPNTTKTTLEKSNTLPPEAIIILVNWQKVISQKWLATQPPPPSFAREGWEVYDAQNVYLPEMRDPNKMQCWLKNGVWYWNKKAWDWLAKEKKWSILSKMDLDNLIRDNKWKDNADTIQKMWIAPVGWFDAHDGEVWNGGGGILRSDSDDDDGDVQVLWFGPRGASPQDGWLWDDNGAVPFVVMDTVPV